MNTPVASVAQCSIMQPGWLTISKKRAIATAVIAAGPSSTKKHSRITSVISITMFVAPTARSFHSKTGCRPISLQRGTDTAVFVTFISPASKIRSSIDNRYMNTPQKSGHCYCQECKLSFKDQQEHSQHLRSTIHVSEIRCLQCERNFSSEQALIQHLRDKKEHHPPAQSVTTQGDGAHSCNECDRQFSDSTALKQHLESVVHRPLSKLKCIASSRCKGRFTSPSALLQHLESGSCRSDLNRASLNQLVQSHDADNMITFGNLVGPLLDSTADDGTSTGSSSPGVLTPSSHSSDTYSGIMGARLGLSALSTDYFNLKTAPRSVIRSGKLSCPLCPGKSRGFRTTQALENHLASPAHAPKIFHCPVNLINPIKEGKQAKSFIKEFSTLSGLTQHVESGACDGGKKMLEEAMTFVQEKLKDLGFEKIKLLK
ncbi:MAG: hypothetical protein Q9172_005934 [Xanthocarpia lactea]